MIHKENTLYKRKYKDSAVYYAYSNRYNVQISPYQLENVYKVLMMAPVKESNMQELYDLGFKQYHDYDPGKTLHHHRLVCGIADARLGMPADDAR